MHTFAGRRLYSRWLISMSLRNHQDRHPPYYHTLTGTPRDCYGPSEVSDNIPMASGIYIWIYKSVVSQGYPPQTPFFTQAHVFIRSNPTGGGGDRDVKQCRMTHTDAVAVAGIGVRVVSGIFQIPFTRPRDPSTDKVAGAGRSGLHLWGLHAGRTLSRYVIVSPRGKHSYHRPLY